ncbi:MAG: hypothetical protein PUH10_00030 [Erysipelotrichaceae bacterium]|uniref:hypothetical protein n=1 Tax=Floccifex sp. TaxID=2815810 RepID=UPI002A75E21D|nr:hypothetical protein [Floccifex sp.]MDD7280377.1 hypothetical protein [Erysipelotrichaceae bacterium]MDY2958469.1 hypothetical protein [Floccifex sp.]
MKKRFKLMTAIFTSALCISIVNAPVTAKENVPPTSGEKIFDNLDEAKSYVKFLKNHNMELNKKTESKTKYILNVTGPTELKGDVYYESGVATPLEDKNFSSEELAKQEARKYVNTDTIRYDLQINKEKTDSYNIIKTIESTSLDEVNASLNERITELELAGINKEDLKVSDLYTIPHENNAYDLNAEIELKVDETSEPETIQNCTYHKPSNHVLAIVKVEDNLLFWTDEEIEDDGFVNEILDLLVVEDEELKYDQDSIKIINGFDEFKLDDESSDMYSFVENGQEIQFISNVDSIDFVCFGSFDKEVVVKPYNTYYYEISYPNYEYVLTGTKTAYNLVQKPSVYRVKWQYKTVKTNGVQTGIQLNSGIYIVLLVVCLFGIIVIIYNKKKSS